MKLHDLAEVNQKIRKAVVAGIKMILVLHAFFLQLLVQRRRPFFEAVVIILTAVEIDPEPFQGSSIFLSKEKRVIVLPMGTVNWVAENISQHFPQRGARTGSGVEVLRRLRDECGTLGAHGREHFGMAEGETQRAVTPHGNTADRPVISALGNAVFLFDQRDELLKKEVAITDGTVCGVDIETASTLRGDDEKLPKLMFLAEVVEQCPAAAVEKRFLIVAKAVEEIQHGIVLWNSLGRTSVIAGWQVHAVVNRVFENLTAQRVALNPTLGLS